MNCNIIHIGSLIKQKLVDEERSIAWLAQKIPCDRSNLYKILKKVHIPSDLLLRISKILDFDFFKYYSENLQNHNNN
jgi:hypothetical protein